MSFEMFCDPKETRLVSSPLGLGHAGETLKLSHSFGNIGYSRHLNGTVSHSMLIIRVVKLKG